MNCEKCGYELQDNAQKCDACGFPVNGKTCTACAQPLPNDAQKCDMCGTTVKGNDKSKMCSKCGSAIPEGSKLCLTCGTVVNDTTETIPKEKMGWHKFLIYFALWFAAIISLSNGISLLTGTVYGENAELIYEMFDGLKSIDSIYGIYSFAMVAFTIFTRFRLAGYYENGPKFLIAIYILNFASSFLYTMAQKTIIPAEYFTPNFVNMFIPLVFAFINYKYYKEREHLFVN